jgi:hypothetical protein
MDFLKKSLFLYQQGFREIGGLGNSLNFESFAQVEAISGGTDFDRKVRNERKRWIAAVWSGS